MLHTERLTLRAMKNEDMDHFFAIFSDKRATRFMPTLTHKDVNETQAWFTSEMSMKGAHYWTITFKDSRQIIGYVNYLGETRFPGMGYMIHPDYWGQGYTPEACRPVLDYGFETLGYDRVELWIDETNVASLRVAQKLGFKVKGRIPMKYPQETYPHFSLVYGMLASEWQADAAPKPDPRPALFRGEPVYMVHDVLETANYYRDTLDFNIDFIYGDPADHGAVSRGEWTGSTVTIQLSRVPAERELTPASYLYIFMDTQLDALCETYRERGVEILAEPKDQPWGLREFAIRDLNGRVLVFGRHL